MKRIFLATLALAALLTSCMKESSSSQEHKVTFEISANELQTRADDYLYGDGYFAYDLEYAIFLSGSYDSPLFSGEIKGAFAGVKKSAEFSQTLAVGKSYDIIFWADADKDPYTIDWSKQIVTLKTEGLVSQDENLDAFYLCETFVVNDDTHSMTFLLHRPLAQLNVATADLDFAASVGFSVSHTSIKVSDVYTQMNLLSGDVIADSKQTVSFAAAPLPKGKNETVTIKGVTYTLLSMNYLLVNKKQMSNVTFSEYDSNLQFPINTSFFHNIDLERNHRTYIIGTSLLTNDVNFTVQIVDGFNDDPYVEYSPI